MKGIDVCRPISGFDATDCDFEAQGRGQDDNEGQPPGGVAAEAGEEGGFDVVDCVFGVDEGEQDVPHEPAADGQDHGDGRHVGFVVHLEDLQFGVDQDDRGCEG